MPKNDLQIWVGTQTATRQLLEIRLRVMTDNDDVLLVITCWRSSSDAPRTCWVHINLCIIWWKIMVMADFQGFLNPGH